MDDTKSLSHTKWNCKYHIVFAEQQHLPFKQELRKEVWIAGGLHRFFADTQNLYSQGNTHGKIDK